MTFEQIYNKYYPEALRYALKFTGRAEPAKDVVHDAFVYLIENYVSMDNPKGALWTALFIEGRRYEAYSFNSHKGLDSIPEPETWDVPKTELPILAGKYQRLIEQKAYGFSNEEIARIEGITESGVRVRLHRARNLL